eukprot:15233240-Alexandrium_andersonii.AAC.1
MKEPKAGQSFVEVVDERQASVTTAVRAAATQRPSTQATPSVQPAVAELFGAPTQRPVFAPTNPFVLGGNPQATPPGLHGMPAYVP